MIIEVEEINNEWTYTGTCHYAVWFDVNTYNFGDVENGATITSPNKLFIQTTMTQQGKIDLANYVINYTP